MGDTAFKAVKFSSKSTVSFGSEVKKRVNEHFKSKKIKKTGDYRIWIKTIVLPILYLAPFVLIVTNAFPQQFTDVLYTLGNNGVRTGWLRFRDYA